MTSMTAEVRFACVAVLVVLAAGMAVPSLTVAGGMVGGVLALTTLAFVRRGVSPPERLGLANAVTLTRLALVAALAGHALVAVFSTDTREALGNWVACLTYSVAALTDLADGAIARRRGAVSDFGARLDAETDAVGVAAASGLLVLAAGTLPLWYLLVGFGRYLFGAGIALERVFARKSQVRSFRELDASPFRRRLAGFQMGMLAVCLAPGIEPEWALPSAVALGGPALVGFIRDYLVVSGRLDPDGAGWQRAAALLDRARTPASVIALLLALGFGTLKLMGAPTGALALGAGFFCWLVRPPRP